MHWYVFFCLETKRKGIRQPGCRTEQKAKVPGGRGSRLPRMALIHSQFSPGHSLPTCLCIQLRFSLGTWGQAPLQGSCSSARPGETAPSQGEGTQQNHRKEAEAGCSAWGMLKSVYPSSTHLCLLHPLIHPSVHPSVYPSLSTYPLSTHPSV